MEKLKSFFRFTSRERLAILLLCLLMVLFWTLPLFFPEKPPKISFPQTQASKASASSANSYAYGDAAATNNASGTTSPNHNRFSNETPTKVAHYFPFDPNTISPAQWQELGLRDKTILTIQHYLQKGGRFRKPDDLRKIWGLKPTEADLLIPYVQIPVTIAAGKKKELVWKAVPVQDSSSLKPHKNWNLPPIDINTAVPEQWMKFPGIGAILAARIVKFRDKMGGFQSIDQVGKTYGIKDSLFQLMKPFLTLNQGAEKKD
jgi:DNA uptake protein ComE-like DNA-binding protein